MLDYQAVLSGHEISRKIVDLLEVVYPIQYNGHRRARYLRNINDHIQGRNDLPLEPMLEWTARVENGAYAEKVEALRQSIQAFQTQKALLTQAYDKGPSEDRFSYKTFDAGPGQSLKIVDQTIYDQAAQAGFPIGFFRDAYFDHVTLYCMPDGALCADSIFRSCKFNVCRLVEVDVRDASLYDCEFHSCLLRNVQFPNSFLSCTHFRDCDLQSLSLTNTHLRRCNITDCNVKRLDFLGAALDGCSFGRIIRGTDSTVLHLDTAAITQSGATAEECARNRADIFHALGIQTPEHHPAKRKQPPMPGR